MSGTRSFLFLQIACLVLGVGIALLIFGRPDSQTRELIAELNRYREMSPEQQQLILKSRDLLNSQSEQRRSQITQIDREIRQHPELKETLDAFSAWWNQSREHWESFRAVDPEYQAEFVVDQWLLDTSSTDIMVVFAGPEAIRLPTLSLSHSQFYELISACVETSEREKMLLDDLEQLKQPQHRALRLTLGLFDRMKADRDVVSSKKRLERIRDALLTHVPDPVWTDRFREALEGMERKPWAQPWLIMTSLAIFDAGVMAIGDELQRQFVATSKQMIDAFDSLSESEKSLQRSLMTMSARDARERLERLAMTRTMETPESRLLSDYNRYAAERRQFIRALFGPGNGPPPRGERPATIPRS